jgi:hypothetical protein
LDRKVIQGHGKECREGRSVHLRSPVSKRSAPSRSAYFPKLDNIDVFLRER